MSKIIAVVPNICEGKDQHFIDDLAARLKSVTGLMMLDVAVDHDHNRTVLLVHRHQGSDLRGRVAPVRAGACATSTCDNTRASTRVSAPLMCSPSCRSRTPPSRRPAAWSVEFAEQVAARFKLPVYLFGESARYRYRRDIENIRQGEYEGFAEKMNDVRWKPDLGPDSFPEDSGVTIIGARYPMISFKVFLGCAEEEVAVEIGHNIADTSGGHVRAYPGLDSASNLAMLTVSLINFRAAPMYRVVENIRLEAARFGVGIRRTELIGLIPEIVLIQAAEYYMHIHGFDHGDLLEHNIQSHLDEKFVFSG